MKQDEGTPEDPHVYGRGTRLSSAYTIGRNGTRCPGWTGGRGTLAYAAWLRGHREWKAEQKRK